jgi:hypothetical protein
MIPMFEATTRYPGLLKNRGRRAQGGGEANYPAN